MICRNCGIRIPENYLKLDSFRCPKCGRRYQRMHNPSSQGVVRPAVQARPAMKLSRRYSKKSKAIMLWARTLLLLFIAGITIAIILGIDHDENLQLSQQVETFPSHVDTNPIPTDSESASANIEISTISTAHPAEEKTKSVNSIFSLFFSERYETTEVAYTFRETIETNWVTTQDLGTGLLNAYEVMHSDGRMESFFVPVNENDSTEMPFVYGENSDGLYLVYNSNGPVDYAESFPSVSVKFREVNNSSSSDRSAKSIAEDIFKDSNYVMDVLCSAQNLDAALGDHGITNYSVSSDKYGRYLFKLDYKYSNGEEYLRSHVYIYFRYNELTDSYKWHQSWVFGDDRLVGEFCSAANWGKDTVVNNDSENIAAYIKSLRR